MSCIDKNLAMERYVTEDMAVLRCVAEVMAVLMCVAKVMAVQRCTSVMVKLLSLTVTHNNTQLTSLSLSLNAELTAAADAQRSHRGIRWGGTDSSGTCIGRSPWDKIGKMWRCNEKHSDGRHCSELTSTLN